MRVLLDPIPLSAADVRAADPDGLVAATEPHVIEEMETLLLSAGERYEDEGREPEAATLLLLSATAAFWLNLDKPKAALVSRGYLGTMRFLAPDDLTEGHLDMLSVMLEVLTNHELRARVADLLWQQRKKRRIADVKSAIADYLASARALEALDSWPKPFRRLQRAWQLARGIGPSQPELAAVDARLMDVFARLGDTHASYFLEALGDLLLETDRTTEEALAIAEQLARTADAIATPDPFRARRYYQSSAKWYRKLQRDVDLQRVQLAAAETYVAEAMTRDATVQGTLLANAVIALRDAGAPAARLADVRSLQRDAAKAGVATMKTVEGEVQIGDIVERVRARAHGLELRDGLKLLARGNGIPTLAVLRKAVTRQMAAAPLRHLFRSTTVDAQGRVLGARGAALSKDPEEAEIAIRAEMTQQAMVEQQLIVRAFVRPFADVLRLEHHIGLRELLEFVVDRPFVPRGRELVFAKALLHGFEDDFASCVAALVPQVENSLRHLLVMAGEHPYNQGPDGVQDVWDLNRVLDYPRLAEIIGEDQVFDLRGLLVSRFGANLRNNVAHGLTGIDTLKGDFSVYLWWRTLFLIAALDFTDGDAVGKDAASGSVAASPDGTK